ncbi:MAG: leucine-rich repeat protein [Alistipes sp.]|nr:leucine-rich repeat protein [Alistipes sp.]
MKRYILICITAMLLMAGCDKNDDAQSVVEPNQAQENVQDITSSGAAPIFEAGFDEVQTRTFIDENVNMLWSADDEISVFYHNTFNRRYRFNGDTGDNRGTFTHAASTDINKGSALATNYAVYPYSKDTSITEDGTISIILPAVQEYAHNSFGVGANTMVAVTENNDDYFLSFKNLCGYLKLKLYGDVIVKSIKLQGENKEPIAGVVTIAAEYGKTPTITMGDDVTSTITLDCGKGVQIGETEETATEFWIVVPPTNFEKGFNISVKGIDGGECFSMTTKARSIERNTVLSMEAKASLVAEYATPPFNAIWYTTTDGKAINNPDKNFGATIISNTYKDGRGVILFNNDITQIPDYAFSQNNKLLSITMPSSITEIGYDAFYNCSSITSLTIPESVTEIGEYAFYNCSNLASDIVIPSGVTKINDYTFYGCGSITSLTIPESVTAFGSKVFIGCGGELTVNCNIPYAKFGSYYGVFAFAEFTKVTIGNKVRQIGSNAFYECACITSISILEGVTSIGPSAFDGCRGITSIAIPESVTSIYDGAFEHCSSITSITIPESVTLIDEYAFFGCSSITSIAIPASVTSIGRSVFSGCRSITSITIPESVTEIGSYAFNGCSSITSITIPESVTSIGSYAFNDCSSITSITIPASVTSIGSHAFDGCGGELTVDCNIPDGGFYNTNFTKVTIGDQVTKIGRGAFSECSSLISVYCKPTTPPSLGDYAFFWNASGRTIYVPTTSVDNYKSSWSHFSSAISGYTFE